MFPILPPPAPFSSVIVLRVLVYTCGLGLHMHVQGAIAKAEGVKIKADEVPPSPASRVAFEMNVQISDDLTVRQAI